MHNHETISALGWTQLDHLVILALATAAVGYFAAVPAARHRGAWPVHRAVLWCAGLASAGAGMVGPVATAAHSSFTAHMVGHVLVGMVAPLLLVLAAPVTLALRALPVPLARLLTRVLRARVVRILTHPVIAATSNMGGLWLLYTTDLYQLMHSSVLVHALVHAHIFLAGYIFTASLVGLDPNPHPTSMLLRSVVLVTFIAAHSMLAKWLYVSPPTGTSPSDGQAGSQLMYYGGDLVDVTLIVLLFAGWYRAPRPRLSKSAGIRPT